MQGHDSVTSRELTRKALKYLRTVGREPFFLWLHYFDPHYSYIRHPEFRFARGSPKRVPGRLTIGDLRQARTALADDDATSPFSVDTVRAIYDEEIAYTDAAIGRLVSGIDRMELRRSIVTVLTADHGEYFMERGSLWPRSGRIR